MARSSLESELDVGSRVRRLRSIARLLLFSADRSARARLAGAAALVLCGSVTSGLSPVALKLGLDQLAAAPTPGQGPILWLVVYAFSLWIARALTEIRAGALGQADQRLQRNLAHRLFRHVMALPLRFHLDRKTGALSQTVANGLRGCQLILHHSVLSVFPVAVELVIAAIVLHHFRHPEFLWILCAAAAAYTVAFAMGVARTVPPARTVSAAQIEANAVLTDSLLNSEAVKSYGAESAVHRRYEASLAQMEGHWRVFHQRRMTNGLAVASIFATSLGASLIYAAHEVTRGTMTIGDIVLVNAYMLQLVRPLEMLGVALRDISQGVVFVERMAALYEAAPETHDRGAHYTGNGELRFDRVTFGYEPQQTILRDVSFTVPAGNTVAIVGASGSGKSSLVRLLLRLYDPISGRIELNGRNLSELSPASVRQAVAVVPQDIVLFNETIAYNIGFGTPGCTPREIEAAAQQARIHDFICGLPRGYDTVVGERGLKLSGGEKQRIAIARAVLRQPSIYVFDEATSSLDSQTERDILESLLTVSRSRTTLIIAHRLSTVVHADEILVLYNGMIVERGSHMALLGLDGTYSAMWRIQRRHRGVTAQTRRCVDAGDVAAR